MQDAWQDDRRRTKQSRSEMWLQGGRSFLRLDGRLLLGLQRQLKTAAKSPINEMKSIYPAFIISVYLLNGF